jgi:predicted PurR-regulated permease PerM
MQKVVLYITIVLIAAFIILSKAFSLIWLLLIVIAMLWSHQREKNVRPVFLISILLFLLYFLFDYFTILVPFLVGFGLAYVLAPFVNFLEKRKIPRPIAILAFLLPIITLMPLLVFLIISGLVTELQVLIEKIPAMIEQIQMYSGVAIEKLTEIGIEVDPNIVANTITSQLSNIISGLFTTIGQIGKGIGGLIVVLYNLVFIPLSAYLFLADREEIMDWFRNQFGTRDRKRVDTFIDRLGVSLARFFRGTLLLMLIVGFIVGFSLWILGIKYYLLLGVLAGVCNLIPNIGYVLSLIPALLIGLLSPSPVPSLIKITGVYVGEQLLENFLLGPLIIGKSSKLHPVVVMIVLILGGAIFGFWGVILAVPLTIFIREFLNFYLHLSL